MSFAEFDTVFERFSPHSRIALAFAHATVDSKYAFFSPHLN